MSVPSSLSDFVVPPQMACHFVAAIEGQLRPLPTRKNPAGNSGRELVLWQNRSCRQDGKQTLSGLIQGANGTSRPTFSEQRSAACYYTNAILQLGVARGHMRTDTMFAPTGCR